MNPEEIASQVKDLRQHFLEKRLYPDSRKICLYFLLWDMNQRLPHENELEFLQTMYNLEKEGE